MNKIQIDYTAIQFVPAVTFVMLEDIFLKTRSYEEKVYEWLFGREFTYHLQSPTMRLVNSPPALTVKCVESSRTITIRPETKKQQQYLDKVIGDNFYRKLSKGARNLTSEQNTRIEHLLEIKHEQGIRKSQAIIEISEELTKEFKTSISPDTINKRLYSRGGIQDPYKPIME